LKQTPRATLRSSCLTRRFRWAPESEIRPRSVAADATGASQASQLSDCESAVRWSQRLVSRLLLNRKPDGSTPKSPTQLIPHRSLKSNPPGCGGYLLLTTPRRLRIGFRDAAGKSADFSIPESVSIQRRKQFLARYVYIRSSIPNRLQLHCEDSATNAANS